MKPLSATAAMAHVLGTYAARANAYDQGTPALIRLIDVARHRSGQSHIVGRFLLGLYNGPENHFDLTSLRGLDHSLFEDCLLLLRLDNQPVKEIHEYLPDGSAIFAELHQVYGQGAAQ